MPVLRVFADIEDTQASTDVCRRLERMPDAKRALAWIDTHKHVRFAVDLEADTHADAVVAVTMWWEEARREDEGEVLAVSVRTVPPHSPETLLDLTRWSGIYPWLWRMHPVIPHLQRHVG
jgi:hypothetical protein